MELNVSYRALACEAKKESHFQKSMLYMLHRLQTAYLQHLTGFQHQAILAKSMEDSQQLIVVSDNMLPTAI